MLIKEIRIRYHLSFAEECFWIFLSLNRSRLRFGRLVDLGLCVCLILFGDIQVLFGLDVLSVDLLHTLKERYLLQELSDDVLTVNNRRLRIGVDDLLFLSQIISGFKNDLGIEFQETEPSVEAVFAREAKRLLFLRIEDFIPLGQVSATSSKGML